MKSPKKGFHSYEEAQKRANKNTKRDGKYWTAIRHDTGLWIASKVYSPN